MTKIPELASPLDSATTALELRGFTIHTDADIDGIVAFELPNRYGHALSAVVEFNAELGILQMSILIIKLQIPYSMEFELIRLLNMFNLAAPGTAFTFDADKEGDDIEVSASHFVVSEVETEAFITRMVEYLEVVLTACMPALYTFLMQKLVHRVDTDGNWKGSRTSLTAVECFEMVKFGKFGTA